MFSSRITGGLATVCPIQVGTKENPRGSASTVDEIVADNSLQVSDKVEKLTSLKEAASHDLKVHGAASLLLVGATVALHVLVPAAEALPLLPAIGAIMVGGSAVDDCLRMRAASKAIDMIRTAQEICNPQVDLRRDLPVSTPD